MSLKKLLVSLITIVLGITAHATHMSGGEIYWECIGPNQFRIKLLVYRDCAGINVNPSTTLNLTSPCGNRTLVVSTPGGTEVSQLCDIQLPNSTCNGGTLPGIEQYIYSGTVTLPPCDSWKISWTNIYRNNAIVNLTNPGTREMYIEGVMNSLAAPCNNSPTFTNTAIPYVCLGYPVSFSYGAVDSESDSLSYALIGARMINAAPIPYTAGYTPIQPIPGLTLNPTTGLINFTLNIQGNWVVVVQVTEYDPNGNVIGTIMRDMQFVAYPCSNIPPDATTGLVGNLTGTAVQTGPREIKLCEGGQFCYDLEITDANANNTLTATTNILQNLPGATISYTGTNPLTVHACWTAPSNAAGFYPFIINVGDGACPIPAYQTYVYTVQVLSSVQANITAVNESCAGSGNGTLTTSITAGATPYTYVWSNGATTPSITETAGTYSVVITDNNNCISTGLSGTIGSAAQPNIANAGSDLVGCQNTLPVQLSGGITNATGGTWSGGAGTFAGPYATATYQPTAQEITAGQVDLILTTTGNTGCAPDADTVSVLLSSSFSTQAISATNVLCNGTQTGTATYTPNNATLSYLWNDTQAQTTATATGLGIGNYTVTVTDTLDCTTQMSVTISEPQPLVVGSITSTPVSCTGSTNGSASVTITGGVGPYTYLWNTGETTATISTGEGVKTVTVTDANGCTPITAQVTVTATGQPNAANAGADQVACTVSQATQLNGNVTNANGGTWSGGTGTFTGTGPSGTSYLPSAADLAAGGVNLILTTTGNSTCPAASDTVHITYPQSFLNSTITTTDALCNGSSDGSAVYSPAQSGSTYVWSTIPVQTASMANGLAAGDYQLHITDVYSCDTTMSFTIGEPAAITVAQLTTTPEPCAGMLTGTATASGAGGTAPYTYTWNNGFIGSTLTAGSGNYSVSITDNNNCTPAVGTIMIDATGQPNAANAGPDQVVCLGSYPITIQGTVQNAMSGIWSGGSGSITGTGLSVNYTPTAQEIQNGGTDLFLTTTGNSSCPPAADTVHITLSNSFLNTQVVATAALCNAAANGMAEVTPQIAGATYQWNSYPVQTSPTATGLAAGNYTVHITDMLGCDTVLNTTITEPQGLTLAQGNVMNITCAEGMNGAASVIATGGTPQYEYSWNTGASTSVINNLVAGSYAAQVTDANGCTAQTSVVVTQPAPIVLLAQIPDTVCVNALTTLVAQGSGGSGLLNYNWIGLGYNDTLNATFTTSQIVSVTVTDQAGCTGPVVSGSIYVMDLANATLTTYGDTTVCIGGSGNIGGELSGYTGTYTLNWTDLAQVGNGPFSVPITSSNVQHVIVSNECGQTMNGSVSLNVQIPPNVDLPPIIAEACAPYTTHFPDLQLGNVSVLWDLGNGTTSTQQSPVVNYPSGTYSVSLTVTTPLGCTATSPANGTVIIHQPPTAAFTASTWEIDVNNAIVDFTDLSSGSISAYQWTFGDGGTSDAGSPSHNYMEPDHYVVNLFVTDEYGCTASADHPILITPNYEVELPTAFTPNANGGSGGGWVTGDLSNDVFYPFVKFVDEFKMRIYNRWGELIFESNDLKIGWDGYYRGEMAPQDMYVVQTWYKFIDGKEVKKLSDLTLIR